MGQFLCPLGQLLASLLHWPSTPGLIHLYLSVLTLKHGVSLHPEDTTSRLPPSSDNLPPGDPAVRNKKPTLGDPGKADLEGALENQASP